MNSTVEPFFRLEKAKWCPQGPTRNHVPVQAGSPQNTRRTKAGQRGLPSLEIKRSSLEQGPGGVHDNWLGCDSLRTTDVASQDLQAPPGKASVRLSHLVPHLVVHGDSFPVLKVAAVGAGRSRACPRRHREEPRTLTPTLWLTHLARLPANPFPASSSRLPAHGLQLWEHFRPL